MIYKTKPDGFVAKFEVASCFLEYKGKILLLLRAPHKPQGKTWGVPAGKLEKSEDKIGAVVRELREEIALTALPSSLTYVRSVYVRYPQYDFLYHIFRLLCVIRPEICINTDEHSKYRWIQPRSALALNLIPDEDLCIKLVYGK